MVICIYGFPTHVSALQFEWAWQHPRESVAVTKVAESFKSFSGVANKIKLAYSMLNVSKWQSMNITVNYFSTKYKKHSAGCPSLPDCMKAEIRQIDDLPCYGGSAYFAEDNNSDYEVKSGESGTACEQENNSRDLQPNYGDLPKKYSSLFCPSSRRHFEVQRVQCRAGEDSANSDSCRQQEFWLNCLQGNRNNRHFHYYSGTEGHFWQEKKDDSLRDH